MLQNHPAFPDHGLDEEHHPKYNPKTRKPDGRVECIPVLLHWGFIGGIHLDRAGNTERNGDGVVDDGIDK